jgi:hypothetical protein
VRISTPAIAGARGLRRRDQPVDRLVDDQAGEHEQRDAVRLGGQDLGAAESERQVSPGRAPHEPDHEQ